MSSSTSTAGSPSARPSPGRPEAGLRHPPRPEPDRHCAPCAKTPIAGGSSIEVKVDRSRRSRPGDRRRFGFVECHGRPIPRATASSRSTPAATRELVSSVNYVAGQTVANAVIAPVSADRHGVLLQLGADRPGRRHQRLVRESATGFTGVSPKRVFDTRAGESPEASARRRARPRSADAQCLEVQGDRPARRRPADGRRRRVAERHCHQPRRSRLHHGLRVWHARRGLQRSTSLPARPSPMRSSPRCRPPARSASTASAPTDVIVDINGWF